MMRPPARAVKMSVDRATTKDACTLAFAAAVAEGDVRRWSWFRSASEHAGKFKEYVCVASVRATSRCQRCSPMRRFCARPSS